MSGQPSENSASPQITALTRAPAGNFRAPTFAAFALRYTHRLSAGANVKLSWMVAGLLAASPTWGAKVTIDELMRLRALFCVRVSADGNGVSYVFRSRY